MAASDEEIDQLRAAVRQFLRTALPSVAVRTAADATGFDEAAWGTLAGSLGLTAIGIPEQYGGAGSSFAEVGVVLEEFGAALAPVPLLPTAVSAAAILGGDREEPKLDLLPRLAAGDRVSTAILGPGLTAVKVGAGWTITGRAGHVPDGAHAALFVAGAEDGEEVLVAVAADDPGVTVTPLVALDATRQLAAVQFAGAAAVELGRGTAVLDRARSAQLTAIACEQVGAAARCLETTVDYAKTRVQFGVPIGSFQAVKHRCADLLVDVEAARSIAYRARDLLGAGVTDLGAAVAAAAWCADAYVRVAQQTVQLHGGIGFTWEHDAHLHVRRARADQLLYGTPREHRRTLADLMGI